jgi:polysaccharide biosynthesis/export protein
MPPYVILVLAVGLPCAAAFAQDKLADSTSLLGPDDQITIRVADEEAIPDKPIRVSTTGNITLPMVGRVHAAGMTPERLEAELTERFQKYIKDPQVTVTRMEIRMQPVSVLGAVGTPGVHQLQGKKTLVEILSLAGGVKEEAGYAVKITRQLQWGRIPLANAADDPTGQFNVAEVPLRDLLQAKNPAYNILIMPNDVITVPQAEIVYVIGEVGKSGAIVLGGKEKITVLQAISLAGGPTKTAKPKDAKILRLEPGSAKREEVPVDLKALLAGKLEDVTMQPEDILFVPNHISKNIAVRAAEAVLQVGSGIAIIAASRP